MYGTTGATAVSRLGPLPLVIGVTGHRDLREEDREALEAQVRGVFAGLRVRYRDTPAILLTPLSRGGRSPGGASGLGVQRSSDRALAYA